MNEKAGVPLPRRGMLLGLLVILAGCAADFDTPPTRRRGADPDDYDTQDPDMDGGMGGSM